MDGAVELLNARARGTMLEAVGLRFTELDGDHALAELDFRPELQQLTGVFHAGALLTLADSAATVLCIRAIDPSGAYEPARFPLTIQLSANLIRNVHSGRVAAEARFVHRGGTTMVVETSVRDERARLLAIVTTTHLVLGGR